MNRIIYDESLTLIKSPFYTLTLPLIVSVITGISTMFFTIAIVKFYAWPWSAAWPVGFIIFTFTQVSIWVFAVTRWMIAYNRIVRGVSPQLETKDVPNVTVYLPARDNPNQVKVLDLPATSIQIAQLSQAVLAGPISESKLIGPSKTFNKRSDWLLVRDALIKRGLLTWRSENDTTKGVNITAEFKDMCERYITEQSPHPGGEIVEIR